MNEHGILIVALALYIISALLYLRPKGRAGDVLISLGIMVNAAFLVMRGFVDGAWFPALMIDEKLSLPLFLALVALIFSLTGRKIPGRVVALALVLCSLVAFLPAPVLALPSAKTQLPVGTAFFLTETVSIALFVSSGFLALSAILFHRDTGWAVRQCIVWGFVIFTICQVLGAVWAFAGWSYPFSWSSRHLVSASIWCLYAALLHAGAARISPRLQHVFAAAGLVPVSFILFYHEFSRVIVSFSEMIP